ncbi:MAG: lytic murein transglycosylase [Pseudomonadota bacterium]
MTSLLSFSRLLVSSVLCVSATCALANTYATHPQAEKFIQAITQKHGLDESLVRDTLAQATMQPAVIKAILPPADPKVKSWKNYRARFLDDLRIKKGLEFWREHAITIALASEKYGVPEEIIVAIIGVETIYGRMTGSFQTVSALATLAFDYPPRSPLFTSELEELFLLARDQGTSPLAYNGSFAGALGLPQFMPSSYRRFAVDFDGDGKVDLMNSPADAIGSVANFLHEHGWEKGGTVAIKVKSASGDLQKLADSIDPVLSVEDIEPYQIKPESGVPAGSKFAVIDLVTPDRPTEYWLGFQNFYTITRYNRSSFYAMSVFHLAQTLKSQRLGR